MESVMLRLVIVRSGPEAKWRLNEWSRAELERFGIIGAFSVPIVREKTTGELYDECYPRSVKHAETKAEEA
jgi:hypothetical protein